MSDSDSLLDLSDYREGPLSLSDLACLVRESVRAGLPGAYWVVGEISEMSVSRVRHTYLTLVERSGDDLLAKMDAVIWADNRGLMTAFEKATGTPLRKGMAVLALVRVNFHDVYGLKLFIEDLDTSYSLGQMARRRREVIEKLRSEGILERNRMLEMPLVPQRIAVVSSATAAGFQDFAHQLASNPRGHTFVPVLFEARVQGESAAPTIVAALERIAASSTHFDVTAIVRGGGSQVDLSCFDEYDVAAAIARHPLPVLTGIGHERDDSVADLAAHTRLKTPTAVAELLIGRAGDFEDTVLECWDRISSGARSAVREAVPALDLVEQRIRSHVERRAAGEAALLESLARRAQASVAASLREADLQVSACPIRLRLGAKSCFDAVLARTSEMSARLGPAARFSLERCGQRLSALEQRMGDLDPRNVLARGFSITLRGGRSVRDASSLAVGDVIETRLYRGQVMSRVELLEDEDARS